MMILQAGNATVVSVYCTVGVYSYGPLRKRKGNDVFAGPEIQIINVMMAMSTGAS
jgi:hypothetical protein